MSDEPTMAITGTYSDFKIIKSRSVAQVIVEVPLEEANNVIEVFGVPRPDAEQWVGIVGLRRDKMVSKSMATKHIQQAGIMARDESFQGWLKAVKGFEDVVIGSTDSAAEAMRALLGIRSRTEMHSRPEVVEAWRRIYDEYLNWKKSKVNDDE